MKQFYPILTSALLIFGSRCLRSNDKHLELNSEQSVILPVIGKFHFKGGEAVLQIGCGDGKITANIAEKNPEGEVIGVDISKSVIEAAKEKFCEIENLSFEVVDSYELNLATKFDLVFSFYTFHWLEDKVSVFNHIKKALKPGGKVFIISVHPENSISVAFERLRDYERWKIALDNRDKNFHPKTPKEYESLLKNLDFKDLKIDTIHVKTHYKNFGSFVDYIMTWLPRCTELQRNDCLELAKVLAKNVYNQLNIKIDYALDRTVPFLYVQTTM